MEQFKGTQGRWKYANQDSNGLFITNDKEIAAIGKVFTNNSLVSECEGEANAKLISTAPELLRHLQKCIEALELIGTTTGESMPLTVSDAKMVINKALGL